MTKQKKTLISVSTKTGDAGTTGLANGERLSKSDPLVELLGTVDEVNSWLGLVAAELSEISDIDENSDTTANFSRHQQFLYSIQDALFYFGAELARSPKTQFPNDFLETLEAEAEQLQRTMAEGWTTKFILPGGSMAAAHADVARAVARRLERLLVAYHQDNSLRPVLLQYANRLSDYLFVLRCHINEVLAQTEISFTPSYFSHSKSSKKTSK